MNSEIVYTESDGPSVQSGRRVLEAEQPLQSRAIGIDIEVNTFEIHSEVFYGFDNSQAFPFGGEITAFVFVELIRPVSDRMEFIVGVLLAEDSAEPYSGSICF